jgi:hypothetical protein
VLKLLSLPPEPSILIGAPDTEDALLGLVWGRYPGAACSALDVRGAAPGDWQTASKRIDSDGLQDLGHVFDLVLFDHAIDDIVVEAVSRSEGLGSGGATQGEYAPRPRAVRAYWRAGELESVAAPEFLSRMQACARALRPNGQIILHHRVEEAHLREGQPMDLYTEYVPLARRWLREGKVGLREASLDSLDPQWWLCLRAE